MRFPSYFTITASVFSRVIFAQQCITESQPNPIAAQYPNAPSGALNGTIAILPIPYSLARSIIPRQYNILAKSYRKLLPWFPKEQFPAVLQLELDHDVGEGGFTIPDFQRAGISFPFVDRLGDGYTSMAYGLQILISASNTVAFGGAGAYGNIVLPGAFEPPCDAYAYVKKDAKGEEGQATYFKGFDISVSNSTPLIDSKFKPLRWGERSPYDLSFWKNVTNQPQFSSNTSACDNFIRLFNTSSSLPPFEPSNVRGCVSVLKPFFPKDTTFEDVYGLNVANGFVENNFLPCESLKGYSGTGDYD